MPRLLQHVSSHHSIFLSFDIYLDDKTIVSLWGLSFVIAALLCSVTRRPLLYAETARQFCASLQEERQGSRKDALSGRSEIDLKL